ncbi:hypothetical protein hmeg3_09720 [Herbaspirillum sp. meg3]|uniref:hypothetical protein n=1 Tax=Herbaspirillum sp. meg3 TaxID=2025949 RepID=UPI000B986E80|nr:hypothetical protein [Herbaspirillum sp. meg3]ASU38546.1 hypothetical protein hmeg3_09720 [Herbaspirillum sp. meg3]
MKKTIYKAILTMALSAAVITAQAWPVLLDPVGDGVAPVVQTLTVFGACGGAPVHVVGINQQSFGKTSPTFTVDGSEGAGIYILGQGAATKLPVSDNNTVICVPVGREFRIVVGSSCAGSACGDGMYYQVVDPKTKKNTAPQICDITCVSKLLKTDALRKFGLR